MDLDIMLSSKNLVVPGDRFLCVPPVETADLKMSERPLPEEDEVPVLHQGKTFSGVNFSGKRLLNREFVKCTFENCDFSKSDLSGNTFMSCVFRQCNFTMATLRETGLRDASFIDCKMLGLDFSACNRFLFSFRFESCILDYSVFFGRKLKKTVFEKCSLKEVDFNEADLSQSGFTECELAGARFGRSNLDKADFRSARNFLIDPETNSVKRTRFSAINLAGLLTRYNLDLEYDDKD